MNVYLTNADLFGSDITDVHVIRSESPNILLNTRFSNGSFSNIDASSPLAFICHHFFSSCSAQPVQPIHGSRQADLWGSHWHFIT
jgi:hypothetical protein